MRSQSREVARFRQSVSKKQRQRKFFRPGQVERLEERRVMAAGFIPAGTLVDFGDAPQSYRTLLDQVGNSHGPVHRLVANVFLGGNVDAEADGVPTANALGDDNALGQNFFGQVLATSDEDGVNLNFWRDGFNNIQPNMFFPGGVSHIQVHANVPGLLHAWIDYNRDGDFYDVNEQIASSYPLAAGANTLTLNVPLDATVGNTYSRFRFTTEAGALGPDGTFDNWVIPNGEVEDHALAISTPRDFGDAPNSYQTLTANNGASHLIVTGMHGDPGVHLGVHVDPDIDGQPTPDAQGDDLDDEWLVNLRDDEDGVLNFQGKVLAAGLGDSAIVTASTAGFLHAWVDFNRDGDFADAGEQIANSLAVVAGSNTVNFNSPSWASPGASFARFRFTTVPGMLPWFGSTIMGGVNNGVQVNGEVEDYQVQLVPGADYGDGPASYGIASHDVSPHYYLGSLVDSERFAPIFDNNALGDDFQGTPDDEDGVSMSRTLLPGSIQTITVTASATGYLNAWVDFDANGLFGPGEQVFTGTLLNPGPNTLTYNVPASAVLAKSFARFRFSQTPVLLASGHEAAGFGEVEDYELAIGNQDFGDAPDSYRTLEQNLGPAHVQDPVGFNIGPFIGSVADIEPDGQPGPLALGDDEEVEAGGLIGGIALTSAINDGAIAEIDDNTGDGNVLSNYFGTTGISGIAVLPDGTTYVAAPTGGGTQLFEVDPQTGLPVQILAHGPQSVSITNADTGAPIAITDLAVQPLTNTIFGIGGAGGGGSLYRIDPATGEATLVGDTGLGASSPGGMAFNREGTLYLTSLMGGTGQLHVINPLTAAVISTTPLVYPVPIPNTTLVDGLTVRPEDNVIFGSLLGNDNIVTIAPAGTMALIGPTTIGSAGDLAFLAPLAGVDDEDGVYFDAGATIGLDPSIPLIQGKNTLWVDSTASPGTGVINLPQPGMSMLPLPTVISGYLNAWIDFNRDGDFADDGEQIAIDLPMTQGVVNPVPFSVPSTFSTGSTFARFRISSETGLSYLGLAADGEVEDYQVTLQAQRRDFGDAPDPTYPTLEASNGARHVLPQVDRTITHNGVNNWGFETGLAGWSTGGLANHVEVLTAANLDPSIAATEGTHYALLSSGPGQVNAGNSGASIDPGNAIADRDNSLLATMFHLDTSHVPATISFDWNLLTSEFTATPGQLDDFFDVTLNGVSILGRSINGVTGSGYADSPLYDHIGHVVDSTGSTDGSSFADGQTGWRRFTFVITQAGDYTLKFQVADQGPDAIFDTGLLIDDVMVCVQPEPQDYLRLGQTVDPEVDGQPTNTTLGDDLDVDGDDEDGVFFTNMILPGLGVPIQVIVNGVQPLQQAFLDAWIDYNQDGDWNDPREQILFSTAVTNGSHFPQTVPVPTTVVIGGNTVATPSGLTRLRMRLSSQGALTPTGQAATGEVEDYLIFIGNSQQLMDFGDAPDNPNIPPLVPGPNDPPDYVTLLGESAPGVPNVWNSLFGGPRHSFDNNNPLYLGNWIDFETNGQPNATATGDDIAGTPDDEDGVLFPTSALVPGETAELTVTVNNAGWLSGWIDFDRDGDFDPFDSIGNFLLDPGENTITISVPSLGGPLDVVNFATYARFRFGANPLPSTGWGGSGEVEDYRVQVSNLDFGDAFNDPANLFDYPTLLSHNGARHIIVPDGPILGADIDAEPDGQPTVQFAADGDDNNGLDDEDGVIFLDPLIPGDTVRIAVNVTQAGGWFRGWMDYNGDLEWDDDDELLDFVGPPVGTQFLTVGTHILSFAIPAATPTGPASFRFRITSSPDDIDVEPNDLISQVNNSGLGFADAPGNISVGTDVDLVGIGLLAGDVITLDIDTLGLLTPLGDSYLRLFDSSGVEVASDDDTAGPGEPAGFDSYLTYTVPSTGTYYIGVSGFSNTSYNPITGAGLVAGSTGNYLLNARVNGQTLLTRGLAFDGEVEDYVQNVVRADFGDAPNSYGTRLVSNGARHPVGPIFLGASVDAEADALPDNDARSDDNLGVPDDEDGVTFAGFTQAQLPVLATGDFVTLSIVSSQANVWLQGWLDLNRNGIFDEPTERILDNEQLVAGVNTFTIQIAPVAQLGLTYARFRVSSEQNLPATGTANDGEVEDYKVQIVGGFDFGDAPDFNSQSPPDYSTILNPIDDPDPGPQHIITGLYLGEKIDHEPDGVPHINSLGDDLLDGNDDEDGVVFLDPLVPGQPARVRVTSTLPGVLNAWFDFRRDGDWDDSQEHAIQDFFTSGGNLPDVITINVPAYATPHTLTHARFRLSTSSYFGNDLGPDGIVPANGNTPAFIPNGEVEDYQIVLGDRNDWGDAPDSLLVPRYPTLSVHGGANENILSGVHLGNLVDPELDGQPNATATGDDAAIVNSPSAFDDEDGVTILDPLIPGQAVRVQVNASVPGFLNAWFDFNADNDWTDPGEWVIAADTLGGPMLLGGGGPTTFTFWVPEYAKVGETFARFRFVAETSAAGSIFFVGSGTPAPASATDLINGLTPTTNTNLLPGQEGSAAVGVLTDGLSPTAFEAGLATVYTIGSNSSLTYTLNTVTNPLGYDISDINVIARWRDSGRSEINISDISYSTVDAPGVFIPLSGTAATYLNGAYDEVHFFSTGGVMATGVAAIQFNFGAQQNTYVGYGELDVFGSPTGAGEVEDYLVNILPPLDFGDAAASFGTLLANNGARHVIVPDFHLGAGADQEANGVPTATSNGDDLATSDDEDGIVFLTPLTVGAFATIEVTASAAGKLDAWVDANGNGTFDPAEQIFASQPLNPGVNTLSFAVPVGNVSNITTSARFRFSQAGGLGPTGLAPDGEVEDYQVALAGTAISGRVFNDINSNGVRDFLNSEPDIVFVIDISNSTVTTSNPVGSPVVPDQNGDGQANTILDDEIAAFIAFNAEVLNLIAAGDLSPNTTISIVTFATTAASLDMNPSLAGTQLIASPSADANGNSVPDIVDVLRSIQAGGPSQTFTNYKAALQRVITTFSSIGTPDGAGFMVFLSDGLHSDPSATEIDTELAVLEGDMHTLVAFGVGPTANVGGPTGVTLRNIDGDAQQLTNPADIIQALARLPQSFNEQFLPGINVYLDTDNDGVFDVGEPTTVTLADDPNTPNVDESGNYAFTNLSAGTYRVRVAPPTGATVTAPPGGLHTVTLVSGTPQTGKDFGVHLPDGTSRITVQAELFTNNGGVPGTPIAGNSVVAGQEFFVRISAKDERGTPAGLIGLALDIDWNNVIFDEADSPFNPVPVGQIVTASFPLLRGGTLDNVTGFIDELRGASLPATSQGNAIGVGTFGQFALLKFRAKAASAASPFTITVGSNGYSTADGAPPASVPITVTPLSVTVTNGGILSLVDNSGTANDARIQFTTPVSQHRVGGVDSTMVRPAMPDGLHWVDVTNTGGASITLSQFDLNAPNVTVSPALTSAPGDDIVLGPGQTRRFTLTYAPTIPSLANPAVQTFNMTNGMVLHSTAPGTPTLNIALVGASTFNSDINYDGNVNLGDLGVFNAKVGVLPVDPTADINGDGSINFGDLGPFNVEFGRTRPLPLMAEAGENLAAAKVRNLTPDQVTPLLAIAQQIVAEQLAANESAVDAVAKIQVHIADLPDAVLSQFQNGILTLDATAAGWGWFVDSTPTESSEFDVAGSAISSTAQGRMDLLTVLIHELGHAAGHADVQDSEHAEEVMTNLLATGTRRLPAASNVSAELDLLASDGTEIALALDAIVRGRTAADKDAQTASDQLFAELGLLD